MNLPNKLTVFRILLVPVIVFVILSNYISLDYQTRRYIATFIFIFASITDAVDGYIARKYNLQTNFGKFMDPLADKILVISIMIALMILPDSIVQLNAWVVIIIISREFFITGFRILAAEQNIVISAGFWGKIKTIVQMLMVILLLLNINNIFLIYLSKILIFLSVILTIISAVDYTYKNREVLKEAK